MKKLLIAVAVVVASFSSAKAGLVEKSLLDNVMTVTQFKNGETNLALMDSVIQFGKMNDKSIFDLQAGFSGNTKPSESEVHAADIIAGGFFKISSLLDNKTNFPPNWEFLRSLEHGIVWQYDFRERRDFIAYQVGLSFDLNPK